MEEEMHIVYKCVFGHRFAKQLKTTVTLEYVFILLAATYLRCGKCFCFFIHFFTWLCANVRVWLRFWCRK